MELVKGTTDGAAVATAIALADCLLVDAERLTPRRERRRARRLGRLLADEAGREFLFALTDQVAGKSVRESKWVDWNRYADELSYAQAFRNQLVTTGFRSNIGMLIDTSRNDWGGSAPPAGPGCSTAGTPTSSCQPCWRRPSAPGTRWWWPSSTSTTSSGSTTPARTTPATRC